MTDKDKRNIYNKLVDLLNIYCDNCLDKQQKDKILLCAFRMELINFAENAEYDTEELWEDIARTLGVKIDGTECMNSSKSCNCVNGVCSL